MQIRRTFLLAVLVAALAIGLVAACPITRGKMRDNSATNGAYRDGFYLGRLAAERGELPHVAFGRWSEDSDRNSFREGYKVAYERTIVTFDQGKEVNPNTSAAYRDGLYLGRRDAEQGREEHVTSGRWAQLEDKALFAAGYRQAYLVETAERLVRTKHASQASIEPTLAN